MCEAGPHKSASASPANSFMNVCAPPLSLVRPSASIQTFVAHGPVWNSRAIHRLEWGVGPFLSNPHLQARGSSPMAGPQATWEAPAGRSDLWTIARVPPALP